MSKDTAPSDVSWAGSPGRLKSGSLARCVRDDGGAFITVLISGLCGRETIYRIGFTRMTEDEYAALLKKS